MPISLSFNDSYLNIAIPSPTIFNKILSPLQQKIVLAAAFSFTIIVSFYWIFRRCYLRPSENFNSPQHPPPSLQDYEIKPLSNDTEDANAVVAQLVSKKTLHLLLHFDINGTLVLHDSTKKNLREDYMLLLILAKNNMAIWGPDCPKEMPYKQYVDQILVPGKRSDLALVRQREQLIEQFINWLDQTHHPLKEKIHQQYHQIKESFTDKATGKIRYTAFNSFYFMLEELRALKIPFTIFLRTFGDDLNDFVQEIEMHQSGIKISHWAKFENSQFSMQGRETTNNISKIYEQLVSTEGHGAIQDDWKTWNRNEEKSAWGKPFPFDLSPAEDKWTLSLFFDDNIKGDEIQDIVRPCEIHNIDVTTQSLLDSKLIYSVNTIEAILNQRYFIDKVFDSIKEHAHR